MTIKELLYARYEASMVTYYETTNERFKGEAKAYQDCIKLVERLEKAIENEINLLIERRFNAYACNDYQIHSVLNTIIEELRGVLDNE